MPTPLLRAPARRVDNGMTKGTDELTPGQHPQLCDDQDNEGKARMRTAITTGRPTAIMSNCLWGGNGEQEGQGQWGTQRGGGGDTGVDAPGMTARSPPLRFVWGWELLLFSF